jgi:hypothetical protein
VNTTKDLDYAKYLGYAGLKLSEITISGGANSRTFSIVPIGNPNTLQQQILTSWQKRISEKPVQYFWHCFLAIVQKRQWNPPE